MSQKPRWSASSFWSRMTWGSPSVVRCQRRNWGYCLPSSVRRPYHHSPRRAGAERSVSWTRAPGLAEYRFSEALEARGRLLCECVLGLEVRNHLGVVAIPQPPVLVDPGFAVDLVDGWPPRCDGSTHGKRVSGRGSRVKFPPDMAERLLTWPWRPSHRGSAPFGSTIFSDITRRAVETGAINLGQGFPNFDGPEFVKEAAIAAIRAGHGQYAPTAGIPELAERDRGQVLGGHRSGMASNRASHVTVTSGCTEALAATFVGLLEPGDGVILIEPAYDAYPVGLALAGAVPSYVTLRPPAFELTASDLEAAVGAAHQSNRRQYAAQPDRPGVHRFRIRSRRRPLPPARPDCHHRRGLRAHGLRRRAHLAGAAAGNVGSHRHPFLAWQDLLAHRLEDRLGSGAA